MRGYAGARGQRLDESTVAAAMIWSEPERDVLAARRVALDILGAGQALNCVWTGRRLSPLILDMDHCLPWSAWPCGDLWNLMPSHREVKQRLKREKLPLSRILQAAGPSIREWWESAYMADAGATRARFMEEAAASLPMLRAGQSPGIGDLFSALELQRLRLRQDQQVPEWDWRGP